MIIVTGHTIASEGAEDEMSRLAVEHVLRSRSEPGCISHEVSRDLENARKLMFVEKWVDIHALQTHIRVPESRAFAQAMQRLTDGNMDMTIYQVDPTQKP